MGNQEHQMACNSDLHGGGQKNVTVEIMVDFFPLVSRLFVESQYLAHLRPPLYLN